MSNLEAPYLTQCCQRPALDCEARPLVRYRVEAGAVTCVACFRVYAAMSPEASAAAQAELGLALYGVDRRR
jgi:hypothetical protein